MQLKNGTSWIDLMPTMLAGFAIALLAVASLTFVLADQDADVKQTKIGSEDSFGVAYPTPTPPQQFLAEQKSQELQKIVDDFVAETPSQFGIVVKDFNNGAEALVNSSIRFPSASLYKLYAAYEIYRAIDQNVLPEGSYEYCIGAAVEYSDNPCGVILQLAFNNLGQAADLYAQGLQQTDISGLNPTTTAADAAFLLDKIFNSNGLSERSNALLLDHLKKQQVNDRIPVGVPPDVEIAHKTGDIAGYVHDVAIVYGPQTTYLLVVMSGPWQSPNLTGYQAIQELSERVYSALN